MPVPQAGSRSFVSGLKQKRPRLRLEPKAYGELSKQVRERDGWRCQNCGTSDSLQVHHMTWRSRMGDDSLENLITLCAQCHKLLHQS
jgi:5-methylcytosine-specific restriction endonuclease McrA